MPTGKFVSEEYILKEFAHKRDAHIRYVKKAGNDFRNRYPQLAFGTIDAYPVIIFSVAHSERHIKQFEEVKANSNFPKK